MASNCCILAKSHAPLQERIRLEADGASCAAGLQLPWHARAVVMLLHADEVRIEHVNAAIAQQLCLAKIGVLTLEISPAEDTQDGSYRERCVEAGMHWLADNTPTSALPVGILWMNAGPAHARRQFVRAALFHNGRVNLANQAEIYRAGISHLLTEPEAGCAQPQDMSPCDKCVAEAPAPMDALSESAAAAQLAMQVSFWFADHLNCLRGPQAHAICQAGLARFARKCWLISGAAGDAAHAPSCASGKVLLQSL